MRRIKISKVNLERFIARWSKEKPTIGLTTTTWDCDGFFIVMMKSEEIGESNGYLIADISIDGFSDDVETIWSDLKRFADEVSCSQ